MSVESSLAKVQKPSGIMRSLSRFVVRYRVASRATATEANDYRSASLATQGSLAKPNVLAQAPTLGLRFVGTYEYRGYGGWIPREGWVSEDGAVRVSARRAQASGVEGAMSAYYLSTTFADGTGIITWAKSPAPIPSSARVENRGGTGDLATDYAAHRAALDRRAVDAAAPVSAVTVDDCVELSTYHDRFMTTDAVISTIVTPRLIIWGMIATTVAFVIALIVRFL